MKPSRFLHLVAHRGNAGEFPQNTLPAMQSALDLGARFIAVDVQASANGVPMVVRDYDLARCAGISGVVGALTAAELAQIDVSEPQRFGARFKGTCIPRLVDALSLITQRRETTLFAYLGRASISRVGQEQMISLIAEAVRPFRSRCILVSTDLAVVYRARQSSGLQIGWHVQANDTRMHLQFEALRPDFLLTDRASLAPTGALWRGPWRWIVHDVPDIEDALALADRGADFVATQNVRSMGEAMRAHAATIAESRRHDDTMATTVKGLSASSGSFARPTKGP
jgi:glycerophosphoryl diester phosphodiesterase